MTRRRPISQHRPRARLALAAVLGSLVFFGALACGSTEEAEPNRDLVWEARVLEAFDDVDLLLHNRFRKVREEVLGLIETLKDPRIGAQLKARLLDKLEAASDATYRANLLYVFGAAGFANAHDLALEALESDDAYLRRQAAIALIRVGAPADISAIRKHIGVAEREAPVREAAQEAFLALLGPQDFARVLARLDAEKDAMAVRFFARALDMLRPKVSDADAQLARALGKLGPQADAYVLRELQGRFTADAFETLSGIYQDTKRPDEYRGLAFAEIARLMTPEATSLRGQLLADFVAEKFDVAALARALGTVGLTSDEVEKLTASLVGISYADDATLSARERQTVRLLASTPAEALTPEAIDILRSALENAGLRPACLTALLRVAKPGDAATTSALVAAIQDERPAVAREAAEGLARLGGPEAEKVLIRGLMSPQASTSAACGNALVRLGPVRGSALAEIHDVLRNPAAQPHNVIAALSYLKMHGGAFDRAIIAAQTRLADTPEVKAAIDDALAAIDARLGG